MIDAIRSLFDRNYKSLDEIRKQAMGRISLIEEFANQIKEYNHHMDQIIARVIPNFEEIKEPVVYISPEEYFRLLRVLMMKSYAELAIFPDRKPMSSSDRIIFINGHGQFEIKFQRN